MFKRVERRQKRKEKEEELGLDEEMKEVMGLQDTDSSESDSNSDDNSDSDSEAPGEEGDATSKPVKREGSLKRKRGAESDEEEGSEEDDDEGEEVGLDGEVDEDGEEGEEEEEEDGTDEDDEPLMSISAALQNPLHVVSLDPEIRTCVVCPGKLLKNAKMIEVHMASNVCLPSPSLFLAIIRFTSPSECIYDLSNLVMPMYPMDVCSFMMHDLVFPMRPVSYIQGHTRRFKKFRDLAMKTDLEEDVSVLLKLLLDVAPAQPPTPLPASGESKRAQKRVRLFAHSSRILCNPRLSVLSPVALEHPRHTPRHMLLCTTIYFNLTLASFD